MSQRLEASRPLDGIVVVENDGPKANGSILYANPAFERVSGDPV